MGLQWHSTVTINGETTTPHDWLREHYFEYTSIDTADIFNNLGIGKISPRGIRHHLKTHLGLSYGQGRNPSLGALSKTLDDDPTFNGVRAQAVVVYLRKRKVCTLRELSEYLDRSEATVEAAIQEMQDAGFGIKRDERKVILPDRPAVDFQTKPLFHTGETVDISFGVVSDTHGGSHAEQPTALNDFVHVAHEEYGIRHVLHPGDAFAGMGVYRGQASEVYAVSGRDQADAVANNLPQYPDLRWYLLGGNHDYSFFKLAGLDVRHELLNIGRDDVTLLPYDAADVPLLPGIDARLWHPAGGVPYALSYRGQKGAEQIAQDELMAIVIGDKPSPTIRMVVIGHLHVMYMFDHGPMVVLGAGCFEGQNSYLKRKQLVPHIGGWVLQCRFVDGLLHRLTPHRIRYREIEDDWRPWWTRRQAKGRKIEKLEPIFSLVDSLDDSP